jgi:ribosomal protein S17E
MEVQDEMKRTGADQMTATMKIVKKYEAFVADYEENKKLMDILKKELANGF